MQCKTKAITIEDKSHLLHPTYRKLQSYSTYLGSVSNNNFDKSALKNCFMKDKDKFREANVLAKSQSKCMLKSSEANVAHKTSEATPSMMGAKSKLFIGNSKRTSECELATISKKTMIGFKAGKVIHNNKKQACYTERLTVEGLEIKKL